MRERVEEKKKENEKKGGERDKRKKEEEKKGGKEGREREANGVFKQELQVIFRLKPKHNLTTVFA